MGRDVSAYFYRGGLNCAETVLRCLIEDGAIRAPLETVRMMTGFGGGMQRGTTCGAVTAAVAALGWAEGRTEPEESRAASAAAVRTFLQRFEAEFGALSCEELRRACAREHALRSQGMYRSCTVFVQRAVDLAEEILAGTGAGAP